MDCRVVVEAAVPVYDVETPDEAVRIAISKTGAMLNPDLNYVEIETGSRNCPQCGESLKPTFIAADESLVALELEMTVFNVEREEHASRIARKEIGQRLENIPLEVIEIEEVTDNEDGESASADAGDDADGTADAIDADADTDPVGDPEEPGGESTSDSESESGPGADDEVLPEFEEMIDE
jgi:Uncharacterized protein conserved in archaea